MNPFVILIEIAVLLLGFGGLVFGMLLINPLTFISDYPPEIQAAYYRTQQKEATRISLTVLMIVKKTVAAVAFLFLFAWLSHLAGATTFWQGAALTAVYILCVFAFDTFFLDWVLFANIKRVRLPGTEHMEQAYRQKWFHVKVCLPVAPFAVIACLLSGGLMLLVW